MQQLPAGAASVAGRRWAAHSRLTVRSCAAVALAWLALLARPAPAQVNPSPQPRSAPHVPDSGLAGDAKILSIRYRCGGDSSQDPDRGSCVATVTKSEFEVLVRALDQSMPAASRQSLAAEYARVLIMAAEARRRRIDESAEVRSLQKFSGLQVLSAQLAREIISGGRQVSGQEVESHFRLHARDYQEVVLSRVFVPARPKRSPHDRSPAALADAIRQRAVNGESFEALQREVPESGSNVAIGPASCLSLPEAHREVCDLPAGQVSKLFSDKLGYFIYRLESRRPRSLDEVREEIRALLDRERIQSELERVRTPISLDLDERYFGPLPAPDVASAHGMHLPAAGGKVTDLHKHQH